MSTTDGLLLAVVQRLGFRRSVPHIWLDIAAAQFLSGHRKLESIARWVFASADQVVVLSTTNLTYWRDHMRLGPKATLIQLGIDPASYEPVTPDRDMVVSLGQVGRDYGTFVEALRLAGAPGTIVHGSHAPMARLADRPPLPNENLEVLLDLPHDEAMRLVARSTIFVLPLRASEYTAGQTVILEAMALGKAIVATASASVEGYLEHGVNALLVPPGDSPSMAAAIRRLRLDGKLRVMLGINARRATEEQLSMAAMQKEFAALVTSRVRK